MCFACLIFLLCMKAAFGFVQSSIFYCIGINCDKYYKGRNINEFKDKKRNEYFLLSYLNIPIYLVRLCAMRNTHFFDEEEWVDFHLVREKMTILRSF